MNYYKLYNDGDYDVVSEYEFYRNSIRGFDEVKEIQTISQVCLSFYKNGNEIARAVGNVPDLSRNCSSSFKFL